MVINLFKPIPDFNLDERQDPTIEALGEKKAQIALPTWGFLFRLIAFELHERLWFNFQMTK